MSRLTRDEQLAKAAATAQAKIETEKRRLRQLASEQRERERKRLYDRRMALGTLCDEAGLAGVDDDLLRCLFTLCANLASSPYPADLLPACQDLVDRWPGMSLEDMAHPTDGVSATH